MKPYLILSLVVTAGTYLAPAQTQNHGILVRRATTTATSASVLSSPDEPTLTGTVSNCNKWYDVVKGDSCWSITQDFGITQDEFEAWNPAVGTDCVVEIGVSYCVGVGSAVSTSTTSTVSTTSTSSTSSSSLTTSNSTGTITSNYTATTPYSTLSYNTTTNPVTITDDTWPPTQTQSGQPSYCISSFGFAVG